ncbi:MAG: DUF2795 domain-containing protein [Actinomycetes bacterium]
MSHQQSGQRGPGEDDRLAHEVRGEVQGNRPSRAEEWREAEPAGEDQPTADRNIVPEDRRGTPSGMSHADVEERSDIARFLGISAYPGDRESLLQTARQNQAPDAVLDDLSRLPEGQQFENVQDVVRALGIGTEQER